MSEINLFAYTFFRVMMSECERKEQDYYDDDYDYHNDDDQTFVAASLYPY